MDTDVDYILQGDEGGFCCTLIALLNAARYFGRLTCEIGDDQWEELVDVALCRYGTTIKPEAVAKRLGLRITEVNPSMAWRKFPTIISVQNPYENEGSAIHDALVVGREGNELVIANYYWLEEPVTVIEPDMILRCHQVFQAPGGEG